MISIMATMVPILKVFICYLLLNRKSDGAKTWWKVSGMTWRIRIAEWFGSGMEEGHHGSHLENLQITSAPEQ